MRKHDLADFFESASESCRLLFSNLNRASELVRSFKQVAVDQTDLQKRVFNLTEYIHEVILSLQPRFRHTRIKLKVEGDEDIVINSYPGAISQIVTNFILNALIHGYEEGDEGTLLVSVRKSGTRVLMEYSNDGRPLEDTAAGKIFEPFFTTRRDAGMIGLGLHIVYNLVTQKLQGHIHFASGEPKGVRFLLDFPAEFAPKEPPDMGKN
jgi:signal transduction histidine kinase